MTDPSLWLFTGITLLIALSPGPNVLLVVAHGLRAGWSSVARAIVGVALAETIYLGVAITGLAALLAAQPHLLLWLRIAGSGYLIYVGINLLASLRANKGTQQQRTEQSPLAHGFFTCLSNPKAMLYWSAFLPQFIDNDQPLQRQMIVLGLVGSIVEVMVLAGYGALAAQARRYLAYPRFAQFINLTTGLALVAVGGYLGWLTLDAA